MYLINIASNHKKQKWTDYKKKYFPYQWKILSHSHLLIDKIGQKVKKTIGDFTVNKLDLLGIFRILPTHSEYIL